MSVRALPWGFGERLSVVFGLRCAVIVIPGSHDENIRSYGLVMSFLQILADALSGSELACRTFPSQHSRVNVGGILHDQASEEGKVDDPGSKWTVGSAACTSRNAGGVTSSSSSRLIRRA